MSSCPACKSESFKYLDFCEINQDTTHDILPTTYKILACRKCNLYFKNYTPNDIELNRFYNSLGENEWDYQQIYPHEIHLKDIFKNLPDGSNVLDIGCNTGRLLKGETERLNCYGVEINRKAARIAELAGIRIIAERVEDDTLEENRYDIITSIDVFEHLNDPLPFINRLVKALRPNGKLYIFTGRTDCLPANICGSHYWYYKPAQHLIFLNKKFIKWFKRENKDLKVTSVTMNHFYSNFRSLVYQTSWLIAWRFFSPNSPYKIFTIRSLAKMKEPFMVTSWKDHIFLIIQKPIFENA